MGASAAAQLPVNFPELLPHVTEGEFILVDDGAVALRVTAASPTAASLEVLNDGTIESRKGVNLPDTHLPIAALTEVDGDLLAWGLRQDIDYVALSFVRAATAPIWQKRIIHAAVTAGRPAITATQMLQSMITSPRATRAEASDVANAIYDATSAVMLSGETAIGDHPVQAVETMRDIALVVEADIEREGRAPRPWIRVRSCVSDAISHGACEVAERIGAAAIVTACVRQPNS